MRFCDTDALATSQSRGYSPNVSFLARPFSHATGQEPTVANGSYQGGSERPTTYRALTGAP